MSGFSKKASQASKSAHKTDVLFELPAVIKMLPLVRQIAGDLSEAHVELRRLRVECRQLDRDRHNLAWPERQRRYALHDSIHAAERRVKGLAHELDGLGVSVVDSKAVQLGFPTIVNGKLAFFSWLPGEETVSFWHYDRDGDRRRPVPEAWYQPLAARPPAKRKG